MTPLGRSDQFVTVAQCPVSTGGLNRSTQHRGAAGNE